MSPQWSLSGGKQTWGGLSISVAIDPFRTTSPLFSLAAGSQGGNLSGLQSLFLGGVCGEDISLLFCSVQ